MSRTAALSCLAVLASLAGCGGGGGSPQVTRYTVSLTVNGTGTGSVTSGPVGLNCPGAACSATFQENIPVTLYAWPVAGSVFAGWGGACSGTRVTCTLPMSGDASVTATFNLDSAVLHTLTVAMDGNGTGTLTSTPPGISCPGTCSFDFVHGTAVVVTATPDPGSTWTAWAGACPGTGACNVTMNADASVTATFTRPIISITLGGDGVGTITSSPPGISCTSGSSTGCSASFDAGGSVTLTASPSATGSFPGWPDPCWGVQGPCTFTINSDNYLNIDFSGWIARRPFPNEIYAAAELGSTRIAVGGGGAVVTSTDSVSWTGHELATEACLRGIAADSVGGTAVAVGELGTILTTTDGASWTSRTSGTLATLRGVARGGSAFVAVGTGGVVLTSPDGVTWTSRTSGTSYDLRAVAFAAGQFVAVGVGGTILTSGDGATWAAPTSNTTQILNGVAWDPKGWVAVGTGGAVVTSPDASTWTAGSAGVGAELVGVTARSGTYAAVDGAQNAYTSTNGTSWSQHAIGIFNVGTAGVAVLGGDFHALGSKGSIATSTDGSAWSLALAPTGAGFQDALMADVAYGNSTYVVVGSYGSIFTSPDGAAWTSRRADSTNSNGYIQSVAFGNGVFVAIAPYWILESADGVTWNQAASVAGIYGGVVAYQPGKGFVVVTVDSTASAVQTSPDGTTWTLQPGTGITTPLSAISCSSATCVAIGGGGSVYTHASPGAGGAWTPQSPPAVSWSGGVEFGNSVFVLPAGSGTYTTANGIAWSALHPVTPAPGSVLGYGGGLFMSGNGRTSADGVTWTSTTPPAVRGNAGSNGQMRGAAYGGTTGWVAVETVWTSFMQTGTFVFLTHP